MDQKHQEGANTDRALVFAIINHNQQNKNRLLPLAQRNAIYAALNAGANPNARIKPFDWVYAGSALHHLARYSAGPFTIPVLDRLIASGADINALDELSRTPLMIAFLRGYENMVRWLLQRGARADLVSLLDKTILHLTETNTKYNGIAISLLVHAGANINALCCMEMTPLMRAAQVCRADVVKKLIELGADTTVTDPFCKTALDFAKGWNNRCDHNPCDHTSLAEQMSEWEKAALIEKERTQLVATNFPSIEFMQQIFPHDLLILIKTFLLCY